MARKRVYGEAVTDAASAGIDLDEAGSAEVIEIAEIKVDDDYQRELRFDLVNKIGREYDIVKAGPILVNERKGNSGGLWCVDGQHRMAGALQAGETEIFAHVVHGLTKKEEAELRLARNDRRSDTMYEKFRTRLVMGDEKAEAMVELVRQKGLRLNMVPQNEHGINAIAAAETLYDAGGGGGLWLSTVLQFLVDTFGAEDATNPEEMLGGTVVGSSMMKGTAWFIDRHGVGQRGRGGVSRTELSNKLRLVGMDEIGRMARNQKAINGGAIWLNTYRAMVAIWNTGRQEKNKIEAKTIGGISALGETGKPRANTGRPGGK